MRTFALTIGMLLLAAGALFAPVVPDTFFLRFGPANYDSEYVAGFLSDNELTEVLSLVRSEGHYGAWTGHTLRSERISLFDYFVTYPAVGILSVVEVNSWRNNGCSTCAIAVDVGVNCGGLCGYGATFYLKHIAGNWEIDSHSVWVS